MKKIGILTGIIVSILLLVGGISFWVDYQRVHNQQEPIFCIPMKSYRDGGTREYYGLGYKIIIFHKLLESPSVGETTYYKESKIGSWFMKYEDFKSEYQKVTTSTPINYIKIQDANLFSETASTEVLVSYGHILYGKSYAMIDYAGNPEGPIGQIDKLIEKEYVPILHGQTNSKELLNAAVDTVSDKVLVLLYQNEAVLFERIAFQEINPQISNVEMQIKEGSLSKMGATIIITDTNTPAYSYGEWFRIDKKENGIWKELTPITSDYAFRDISWTIGNTNTLEQSIHWSDLYGPLDSGQYRLVKHIYQEDYQYFSVEFTI